jgi:hypothetical protein
VSTAWPRWTARALVNFDPACVAPLLVLAVCARLAVVVRSSFKLPILRIVRSILSRGACLTLWHEGVVGVLLVVCMKQTCVPEIKFQVPPTMAYFARQRRAARGSDEAGYVDDALDALPPTNRAFG